MRDEERKERISIDESEGRAGAGRRERDEHSRGRKERDPSGNSIQREGSFGTWEGEREEERSAKVEALESS